MKSENSQLGKFQTLSIWKNPKISNFRISKNFQIGKFQKFPKFYNFDNHRISEIVTLVYVFTMRVVIYDILSMAIIPTLSTSILFCNLCYILL